MFSAPLPVIDQFVEDLEARLRSHSGGRGPESCAAGVVEVLPDGHSDPRLGKAFRINNLYRLRSSITSLEPPP